MACLVCHQLEPLRLGALHTVYVISCLLSLAVGSGTSSGGCLGKGGGKSSGVKRDGVCAAYLPTLAASKFQQPSNPL